MLCGGKGRNALQEIAGRGTAGRVQVLGDNVTQPGLPDEYEAAVGGGRADRLQK